MSCPAQRLFLLRDQSTVGSHKGCFHHPRGVVWGKSCLSLTEQVLDRDNVRYFWLDIALGFVVE